jgi:hypothetical protein
MPASEAKIAANRTNAQKSTGPKTEAGKAASRGNGYKHGMTATVVFPEREAAEVDRRTAAFVEELKPSGEIGVTLIRVAAIMSARVERCVQHATFVDTARVKQAEAEFVPPEGASDVETAQLREAAGLRLLFDASREAVLARRYETAAINGFFRALRELRSHEKSLRAAESEMLDGMAAELVALVSGDEKLAEEFRSRERKVRGIADPEPARRPARTPFEVPEGTVDVPITIGRRR